MVAMYGRGARSVTKLTMRGKTQVVGRQKPGEELVYLQERDQPPIEAMNDNSQSPWFIVVPNTNHDRKVVKRLSDIGVTVYRPTYTKWKKTRTGREEIEASLLPKYLFIRFNGPQDWFRLRQTDGVQSVLCDGYGMPKRISASELRRIADEQITGKWDQVRRPQPGMPSSSFSVGQPIEPAEGHPLAGMISGIVEKITAGGVLMRLNQMFLGKDEMLVPAGMVQAVG